MLFRILIVVLIIVPALELWGLFSVGKVIGGWTTVALVICTSVLGAWLAKQQGLQAIRLVQLQLSRGEMPTDALFDGIIILAGGIMLLTPGFITDIVGLVLLFPYTRMIIRHFLKKWILSLISSGKIQLIFRR